MTTNALEDAITKHEFSANFPASSAGAASDAKNSIIRRAHNTYGESTAQRVRNALTKLYEHNKDRVSIALAHTETGLLLSYETQGANSNHTYSNRVRIDANV